MNITPNANVKVSSSVAWTHMSKVLDDETRDSGIFKCELIEYPPQLRTIKCRGKTSKFCKIPYTQFYFTKFIFVSSPIVFVTNSNESVFKNHEIRLHRSIFENCNYFGDDLGICFSQNSFYNVKDTLNFFWNSKFDHPPDMHRMQFESYANLKIQEWL